MNLRLATRKSALALAQSRQVAETLQKNHPGLTVELVELSSLGDDKPDEAIAQLGQEGVFVKALEQALRDGKADLAVHSLKDVPTDPTPGLTLAAFLERGDPRDVLIAKDPKALLDAPQGKKIGTSSLRRKAYLKRLLPGVEIEAVRGNLDTRIDKALSGELDGVVVSLAGLTRLGRQDVPHHVFAVEDVPPAVGQGVIAVQCREDDKALQEKLSALNHHPTELFARCEREFLREMSGGCLVPIGAQTSFFEDRDLLLEGWIADPDGDLAFHGSHHQRKEAPEAIGAILASRLLQHGGRVILNKIRGIEETTEGGDSAEEPAG